ncbi:MAG: hypothetical protein AAGJ93_17535, partial [Bacteroidota bacterium]
MPSILKSFLQYAIYYPLMIFVCLEIALRILGYQHYQNDDYKVVSTPVNAFIGDPQMGIALNPGIYQIQLNEGLTFQTTHLENGTRLVKNRKNDTLQVLILGCSFTYGYGVDDEEHFSSLLQADFPDLGLQNAGVIGYGTLQSWMQLQEILETNPPETVLLHFSSYHFMRNTLSPQYRSNLKIGYQRSSQHIDNLMQSARFPYQLNCSDTIAYAHWTDMYDSWPGRDWLAAVNWIQTTKDQAAEDIAPQLAVTTCVMEEMQTLCNQKGVTFGVVCLDETAETISLK